MDKWKKCLGEDVNRMVCRVRGWGLVLDWIGIGDGGDGNWGVGLSWDWAIVCGVCYYRKLLQMQQLHPNPLPRLVITNSAVNTC